MVPSSKESVAVNSYCSQSKQLILLYYIVTHKSAHKISTNCMVMFKPFGQHKIQNQISKSIQIEISL